MKSAAAKTTAAPNGRSTYVGRGVKYNSHNIQKCLRRRSTYVGRGVKCGKKLKVIKTYRRSTYVGRGVKSIIHCRCILAVCTSFYLRRTWSEIPVLVSYTGTSSCRSTYVGRGVKCGKKLKVIKTYPSFYLRRTWSEIR